MIVELINGIYAEETTWFHVFGKVTVILLFELNAFFIVNEKIAVASENTVEGENEIEQLVKVSGVNISRLFINAVEKVFAPEENV